MKRRKGNRRPPTVCNNCRYIIYDGSHPLCLFKIQILDESDSFEKRYYHNIKKCMCDKKDGCGFEEKHSLNSTRK